MAEHLHRRMPKGIQVGITIKKRRRVEGLPNWLAYGILNFFPFFFLPGRLQRQ